MSPHQRAFSGEASAVKPRRIRSARDAAAGSGIAVFVRRRAARPLRPRLAHQSGDALAAMSAAAAAQPGMHSRGAVAALGFLVHSPDLAGEVRVGPFPPGRACQMLTEGGAGDLQQLARPLDVALLCFPPPR
jgi:hypothetical protein